MAELLSQEEIDALLSTLDKEPEVIEEEKEFELAETKKISIYDFKRPDKVSKEQIRALKNLHDKFARNFSSRLSGFLRAITEINVVSVDQMTYGEFVLSLSNNVSFNVVSLNPLEGSAVFSIEPDIGFVLIDRLLGGIGEFSENLTRPFTDIEQAILADVVRQAMDDMREIWDPIVRLDLKIVDQETSPNVIQIIAPSEIVVLVVFEVKIGESRGIINWCLPVIALEPIFSKIGSQDLFTRPKRVQEDRSEDIAFLLLRVPVIIDFYLGKIRLKLKEFLELETNEVLVLDSKVGESLLGSINGVKKVQFVIGRSGSNQAVKVLKLLNGG